MSSGLVGSLKCWRVNIADAEQLDDRSAPNSSNRPSSGFLERLIASASRERRDRRRHRYSAAIAGAALSVFAIAYIGLLISFWALLRLYRDNEWGMVKLTPEQQGVLLEAEPKIFAPAAGAWGRRGYTHLRLAAIDRTTLLSALTMAWRNTAPKRLLAKVPLD